MAIIIAADRMRYGSGQGRLGYRGVVQALEGVARNHDQAGNRIRAMAYRARPAGTARPMETPAH
jgi:hypothetical protein